MLQVYITTLILLFYDRTAIFTEDQPHHATLILNILIKLVIVLANVGEQIRLFRKQLKLTQKQLADQLNVSRSVLTKWEIGTLTPDLQALVQLSEKFEVSIDALVGRPYPPAQVLHEVRKLYQSEEEESIDEEMIQIIQYLHSNPEIKNGLYLLTTKQIMQRKPVEEIIKTIFKEILKP